MKNTRFRMNGRRFGTLEFCRPLSIGLLLALAHCAGSDSNSGDAQNDPAADDALGRGTAVTYAISDSELDAALAYWTEERMGGAVPVEPPATPEAKSTKVVAPLASSKLITLAEPTGPTEPAQTMEAAAAPPSATHFDGIPVAGALFHTGPNGDHVCSASVVASKGKNLIVSAGHCLNGSHLVFVPKYHRGVRPYGTWGISGVTIDSRYVKNHDIDLDFAFAKIAPLNGKNIENVVGANGLQVNKGYSNRVTIVGYPTKSHNPSDQAIICSNTTKPVSGHRYQVEFDCHGYYGGTSGSAWVLGYDSRTGRGYTNGVIGGLQEGGPNDLISYTSYFDKDIGNLYAAAQR